MQIYIFKELASTKSSASTTLHCVTLIKRFTGGSLNRKLLGAQEDGSAIH